MTEEQIRKRIIEIDKERATLAQEKEEYTQYLQNTKEQKIRSEHEAYVGKYYVSTNSEQNEHEHIKAFKVLSLVLIF